MEESERDDSKVEMDTVPVDPLQSVIVAKKVLTERLSSLLIELDGLRILRHEIDTKYQQFQEKVEQSSVGVLRAAKYQWKIDILKHKAKITDNMILKGSLTYAIIAERLQKLSMEESEEIAQSQGSDIYLAIENNPQFSSIEQENQNLKEEIYRIEQANIPKAKQIDESNQDLILANRLLEASKEMEERGSKGYNDIEKIIRNPSSKEGYNINNYINKYLEGVSDLPPIWDFIYAIRDQLMKTLCNVEPEEIESSLENYMFPILYNKMIAELDLRARDDFVLSQCKKYGNTTQDQFNINPDFKDNALVPYVKAIAELRSIYFQFTPTKKMSAILRAASAVYEVTGQLQPKIKMGGDDFIDIFVYVVLHSQLRNLPSTVQYISYFASEDLMTSEMGYYFTSVEVALNFIEKLTDEKLKESPSAYITGRPFVVCEKARYRLFCSVDKNFDLTKDNVVLHGFRLYVIEEWVQQPGRFYTTYLHYTKDPNDKVVVCVLKANENISPAQQGFIHDTFFRDKPEENLIVEETMHGTVLCSTEPPSDILTHVYIASGDYDLEIDKVKMVVNLKTLHYDSVSSEPPYLSGEQKIDFIQRYNIIPLHSAEFPATVVQFIKDVQTGLKHLNYFPYLCVIDGILSSVLTKSIVIFQMQYNESTVVQYDAEKSAVNNMHFHANKTRERPPRLDSDGNLTPDTWDCIKFRVETLRDALSDLGFDGVDDPFRQHNRFTEIIKKFQETVDIIPDGLLSQKTIQVIVNKWESLQKHNDWPIDCEKSLQNE